MCIEESWFLGAVAGLDSGGSESRYDGRKILTPIRFEPEARPVITELVAYNYRLCYMEDVEINQF